MAVEIERKFLVLSADWRRTASFGRRIRQGYLSRGSTQVRVRCVDDRGYLTVKGAHQGCTRLEFEYEIPLADAEAMIALCEHEPLEKTRFEALYAGRLWVVDVYGGRHTGLVVAEIELDDPRESFERPPWLGPELTGDPRFSNSVLAGSGPSVAPSTAGETAQGRIRAN